MKTLNLRPSGGGGRFWSPPPPKEKNLDLANLMTSQGPFFTPLHGKLRRHRRQLQVAAKNRVLEMKTNYEYGCVAFDLKKNRKIVLVT